MWCKLFISFIAPTLLIANAPSKRPERTLIIIKPDGIQRGIVGPIIKRFEDKGFKLIAMKLMKPSMQLLLTHYIKVIDKRILDLVTYMSSGPVMPMVWEGANVVEASQLMIGATDPAVAKPGTIRGDFGVDVARNLIHGSDSVANAEKEIQLWFSKDEIVRSSGNKQ